jgi:hypothetical protein
MKELGYGILIIILALIASCLMFTIGTAYSLGYSIYMSLSLKDWKRFPMFWWRILDGYCACIGHVLFETGVALDMAWNVNGEILEDMVTSEENTSFSNKNITVSASVGKLESSGHLNRSGEIFSKLLNIIFGQKNHAIASWLYHQYKTELKEELFIEN